MNTLDIDPFHTTNLLSPNDFQRALRAGGPIVWLPNYGIYATGHFQIAKAILDTPSQFISGDGVGITCVPRDSAPSPHLHPKRNPLIEVDPPQHTVVRALVEAALPASLVKQIASSAAAHADALLGNCNPSEHFDAVADFAVPLALGAYPQAFGLRTQDRSALVTLGELAMNSLGPRNQRFMQSAARLGELKFWLSEHLSPTALKADSIGATLYASASRTMEAVDAQDLINTVLISGIDTFLAGLSSTLYCLANNADQWQLLHDRPELASRAFEEAVRLEAPIQMCYRTVRDTLVLAEETLQAGSKIMIHLGAASRDETYYQHPDRYDLQREERLGLAFGSGVHRCVGRGLALLQSQAVINVLLHRFSSLRLTASASFHANNTLRRLSTLPLQASLS